MGSLDPRGGIALGVAGDASKPAGGVPNPRAHGGVGAGGADGSHRHGASTASPGGEGSLRGNSAGGGAGSKARDRAFAAFKEGEGRDVLADLNSAKSKLRELKLQRQQVWLLSVSY